MRHIDPDRICSSADKITDCLRVARGRTDGRDDFGVFVHRALLGSVFMGGPEIYDYSFHLQVIGLSNNVKLDLCKNRD